MKWTFSIKNKFWASAVLLVLCILVLLSNYLDRLHTENVKSSISTMYEDRLIVEDYILKMTRNTYQIWEILHSGEDPVLDNNAITSLTADFQNTYNSYIKTKLTKTEAVTTVELINHFKAFEKIVFEDGPVTSAHTDKMLHFLKKLSIIQLEESKLIMKQVESQYAVIKASSQFAFAIIIIILIVLQILVFSGESIVPIFKPKDPTLN